MFHPHGNDLILGHDATGRAITLTKEQRATHLYTTGTTGTGKSKFLEHLIR
jgi:DNA segregation ATPase FtsK/SpoIIIE-like protein